MIDADERTRRRKALGGLLAGCAALVVVLSVTMCAERDGRVVSAAPAAPDMERVATVLEQPAPATRAPADAKSVARAVSPAASADLERSVAELARALDSPDYDARRFESAARALAASLPDAELARLGTSPLDSSSSGICVARGVLARVAPVPLGERRALAVTLCARLRGWIDDEAIPLHHRAQMGAVLAALGEPADRARLFDAFAAPMRPGDRIVARAALAAVEGPGAGAELIATARKHASSDAGAELLAAVGTWAQSKSAALPVDELDACSALLEEIAEDETTTSVSRTRALAALRVLDAPRASARALAWLSDQKTDPVRLASACASVRRGDVDADRAALLLADLTLPESRRMDVVAALAARPAGAGDGEAARGRAVDTALDLLARSEDPDVRRRAASIAGTSTRPGDRVACANLATTDPDAGVRAAARSALARSPRER